MGLSILISSMSNEVMYVVAWHAMSHALWQTIKHAFSSTSMAHSLSLLSQLQSLRQGDSTTVEYLGNANVLIEQLAKARQPLGLDEQNLYILKGLCLEYRAMVSFLTTKELVTINQLSDFLTAHQFISLNEFSSSAHLCLRPLSLSLSKVARHSQDISSVA